MTLHRSTLLRNGCLVGAVMFSLTALAQTDATSLGSCYSITDNNARLACYDALARPAQQDTRAPVVQAPAPPVAETATPVTNRPAPAATVEETAPVRTNTAITTVVNIGEEPRIEADAEGEAALVGTVAAIKEVEPQKLQITLSNGQVWKQSIGKSFLLRENDTVRITRSPWGDSFRLQKDGKPAYIQVQRLR